MENQWNPDTV